MGRAEFSGTRGRPRPNDVKRFTFLLLNGFPSLDLSAGIDSLAAANAASGTTSFSWTIVGESEAAVTSSSGIQIAVDSAFPDVPPGDCVVICAPLIDTQQPSKKLINWLRRASRYGAQICGLGGGTALLAHAGLAGNRRLSTHWKLEPALAELFPNLDVVCSVYEEEKMVATSGGGVATLDLFSALITQKCGAEVASNVADQLLYATARLGDDRQTRSDLCRLGHRHEKLGNAIQIMQQNPEDVVSPSDVAERVGLSTRQLERLFKRYVGSSPKTPERLRCAERVARDLCLAFRHALSICARWLSCLMNTQPPCKQKPP